MKSDVSVHVLPVGVLSQSEKINESLWADESMGLQAPVNHLPAHKAGHDKTLNKTTFTEPYDVITRFIYVISVDLYHNGRLC